MTALTALPVLLPLLAAGASLALARHTRLQRLLTAVVLLAVVVDAAALLTVVHADGPVVVAVGGWAPPLGIALVADELAALLLMVSVLVTFAVLLFAVGQGSADGSGEAAVPFHPAYLLLNGGVSLAFFSGDLFNLFVAFEVMLASSYVLITLNSGEERARAGMTYTLTSLTSSMLFLTAIALVYAATGTVNLADLVERMAGLDEGVRAALTLLLLVVFGIKAAVVPLHFWLPDSYPSAPVPVTALFAALLTKVGVYAMLRTQSLLFPREGPWEPLAVVAVVTLLVGILGAIAQDDINRLLSFTLVSHIGFMLFGLALFDGPGFTGTILYMVHHIVVQASLFLVAGLLVGITGTTAMHRMGQRAGVRHRPPAAVALLFFLPALSLAGVPPFAGFVAKFALLRAAVGQGGAAAFAVSAAALLTSLLTLYAMVRVWRAAFPSAGPEGPSQAARSGPPLTVGATTGMVVVGLVVAVCAGPLVQVGERAADHLVRPGEYREAVLAEEGA